MKPPRVRPAELAIAAVVIAVVAMLIIPLPRPLLDVLFALNIGFAVALLMAALFTRRPLGFASFPTLLVVGTLFRVGLEVSATRLVLADADAGEVVAAFGGSVVAGSLVVGLVVFAVITIVQLIVVARGAERVAEVAARFALDAMPGKQMAVDADLRAGTIDAATAKQRRADLERESQLYGAMDGAMRFVKGDAIAAIVIVVINLVGGMVIGVGSRGMTASAAMHTYSLLSIGEGLVAQIPALLVAVASGLLVTRVASTGDRPLGDDLGEQLGGQPRVLVAVAILLVGLALVPGLPLLPFLGLGLCAAAAALMAMRRSSPGKPALDEPGATGTRGPALALRFAPALHATLAANPTALHAALGTLRAEASARCGFAIPPFAIASDPTVDRGCALAVAATPVAWLDDVTDLATLTAALPAAIGGVLAELVTLDRAAVLVDQCAQHSPVLVKEVIPRVVSLAVFADVLRGLVREQVPIAELATIVEAIALAPTVEGGFRGKDVPALVEHLRGQLRRQITARWAPRGQLAVYTIDGMIEDAVRSAIDRRDGAQILALEPAIAADIVAAVRASTPLAGCVILASGDIRRHLRALLEPELPDVAILAAHELAPGTAVRTTGRIEVA